eukprot:CAMPEP_0198138752 /NCGR_PEP_ID=MMETSP1443-20131203/2152_1 /TAXON_ID=186043 /ORGANISM="Entomoneis sp., Strain CCMP2396" /LENGTH=205 /DNA_ID=CAMNT_0043800669 /DNA_START=42 /DNA_END=656 /DNA_ORIENTATION=-
MAALSAFNLTIRHGIRQHATSGLVLPGRMIGGNLTAVSFRHQMRLSSSSNTRPPPRRDIEKIIRVAVRKEKSVEAEFHPPPTFLQRFLGPKDIPERYTFAWYGEMVLICTVFGITGSSTMLLVRPAVKDVLGIEGTFRDGPWSYRICSIVIMSPIYASLLVAVGTIFGRHAYFRHFAVKIFSRFGIPAELMDKNWKVNKNSFKKW